MARDFMWYLLRGLAIVCVIYALGGIRCTSSQLRAEVIHQQNENTGAKATAARYIPEGPDRDRVFNALDNSSELMGRQDQKLTKETQRADENQADADMLFWLKWGGGLVAAGLLVLYLKSR